MIFSLRLIAVHIDKLFSFFFLTQTRKHSFFSLSPATFIYGFSVHFYRWNNEKYSLHVLRAMLMVLYGIHGKTENQWHRKNNCRKVYRFEWLSKTCSFFLHWMEERKKRVVFPNGKIVGKLLANTCCFFSTLMNIC